MDITYILAFIICLFFSGFFSGAEVAVLSVSRARLHRMAGKGRRSARALETLLRDPASLLTTILIGNNLVNVAAPLLANLLIVQWLMPFDLSKETLIGITTVTATIFLLVVGEITPKSLALHHANKVAFWVAPPLWLLRFALRPVVWLFTRLTHGVNRLAGAPDAAKETPFAKLTREDLQAYLTLWRQAGLIVEYQAEVIENVLNFAKRQAKDIMVPRADVEAATPDINFNTLRATIRRERYSRYPVFDPDSDQVVGVLSVRDVFGLSMQERRDFAVMEHVRPPYVVHEYQELGPLFRTMQYEGQPVAIVVDEYGSWSGLLTIEDLVEELVGDILDEFDDEERQPFQQLDENTLVAEGSLRLEDLASAVSQPVELEVKDADTLAGYVLDRLGHFPRLGESVKAENLTFTVRRLSRRRITEIEIKIGPDEAPPDGTPIGESP